MTIEQTIKWLKGLKANEILSATKEALDVAIKALEEKPIRCKDCKHQKKYWHEDKRMKDKGYWIYGCNLIDDPFVGTPVWGGDNQFCSSAKQKGGVENDS